jgi:arylsulfatase A-like enzyme/Tfp pilus assembly protein PilF
MRARRVRRFVCCARRSVGTLALFLLLGACGRGHDPREALRGLNVILVTIDTLRVDHVSAYGDRARTPHIDALAGEGVLFERCLSQTPLTLPAHVSLLSGTYPLHHRVRDNGGLAVPEELELVSETLHDHGFATAAFVGAYVLHSKWGLDQGFDLYSDEFNRARYERILLQNEKRAPEVLGLAEEWLRGHGGSPFFAWIHLFDPHAPYDPPAPFDETGDPYRGEVEFVDAALGDFFAFLRAEGLYENSLIVLTADHGEGLGGHGEREHGFFVYDPTVHVPLIVRAPVAFPVKRVSALVEHVDVMPTILDLVGVPLPAAVQGESLTDLMFGAGGDDEAIAYTETFYPRLHLGWSELRALYQGTHKYVSAPRDELYDLTGDPAERKNLAPLEGSRARREELRARLQAFVESGSEGALDPAAVALGREDAAALRALGYVATTTGPTDGLSQADPKDRIDVFNRLNDATARMNGGDPAGALAAARDVLESEPGMVEALVLLGHAHQRLGEFREAAEIFQDVLEQKPDSNFAMIDRLSALINLGEYDRVIEETPAFLERFPEDPVLHEELGLAHFFKGEDDAALVSLDRSIELGPSPVALARVGEIQARRDNLGEAESWLRKALALDPRQPGAHYTLAQIAQARGRAEEALALYREELECDPRNYRAAFNAAVILKKEGRDDEAVRFYRRTIDANPDFNVPYFMVAEHLLEKDADLDEAVALCQRGIEVAPHDETALLGYQVLMRLFVKTGDRASYERYAARAEALVREKEGRP